MYLSDNKNSWVDEYKKYEAFNTLKKKNTVDAVSR